MGSPRGLFPQERDEVSNSYFTLEEDTFQRFRSQVSPVTGNHDVEVHLIGVPQIGMASCLVMDVEACAQKHAQKLLGSDSRQLWHQKSDLFERF